MARPMSTPAVATTFDFSAEGGLLPAAELCAGVGECRKTRAGTMCPSYQATRDERDSTRGRANALRLAITGQLGFEGFTDPALHEVLDLCLECKACKGECPTNVDMARLKAEFLHQYHKKHGLPLRNRVFGNVARIGRLGLPAGPGVELAGAEPAGPPAQRGAPRHRPPPRPPGVRPPLADAGDRRRASWTGLRRATGPGRATSCSSPTRSSTTTSPSSASRRSSC